VGYYKDVGGGSWLLSSSPTTLRSGSLWLHTLAAGRCHASRLHAADMRCKMHSCFIHPSHPISHTTPACTALNYASAGAMQDALTAAMSGEGSAADDGGSGGSSGGGGGGGEWVGRSLIEGPARTGDSGHHVTFADEPVRDPDAVRFFSTEIYTRGCHWFPRLLACQWYSSRVSTFLTGSHCELRPNTEGSRRQPVPYAG
jgi:hypothetical protein